VAKVVWLEIETCVIGKGGVKRSSERGVVGRKWYGGCWILWPFFFFGYISNVVVEGVCVRHCMGPRVYKVGTAC
jgi:hypothetical protein